MKRNLKLIRAIMLEIEASNKYRMTDNDFKSSTDINVISYHLDLLLDSNYIVGESFTRQCIDNPKIILIQHDIYRLTNYGHDFLDSIKDDKVFNKVLSKLKSKSIDVPLKIIEKLAVSIIANHLDI